MGEVGGELMPCAIRNLRKMQKKTEVNASVFLSVVSGLIFQVEIITNFIIVVDVNPFIS